MRKRTTVKIDDKEIDIKELRVKDIMEIFGDGDKVDLKNMVTEALPRCSDLKTDDLMELAPSELKILFDAFKEVNEVFFDLAGQMGLGGVLEELKGVIRREFSAVLADSSRPATSMPSTTDTPTSS